QMVAARRKEQIKAAKIGRYAALIMLNYPSSEISADNARLVEDIKEIIRRFSPETVYTHNPADKHKTHVNVVKSVVSALRQLPDFKPKEFFGCECWRDLDWLNDGDKIVFDLSGHKRLLRRLIQVHKSQIKGGKRYDLAIQGRRLANATFHRSHDTNTAQLASFGMDLTPLLEPGVDPKKFTEDKIDNFKNQLLL
ncbi:MAG: PIG-L family deacetylase, partial [Clostridia bacterium]|nr:PIG-L family deacetylase [Clostridia bacterium]